MTLAPVTADQARARSDTRLKGYGVSHGFRHMCRLGRMVLSSGKSSLKGSSHGAGRGVSEAESFPPNTRATGVFAGRPHAERPATPLIRYLGTHPPRRKVPRYWMVSTASDRAVTFIPSTKTVSLTALEFLLSEIQPYCIALSNTSEYITPRLATFSSACRPPWAGPIMRPQPARDVNVLRCDARMFCMLLFRYSFLFRTCHSERQFENDRGEATS